MKIYQRILFNTLPLIFTGIVLVGSLTFYLSKNAMSNLAEKLLATKLADATRIASEDVAVLRKYGLEKIEANVIKAKAHAAEAINMISLGINGYVWVVDAQGMVVVHPNSNLIGNEVNALPWFQQMAGHMSGKCLHKGRQEMMLAAYKYFSPWDWFIMASAPQSELYGEANRMRSYIVGAGLAALVMMALVSMILARRLTAPLNMLAKEAERIGRGDHREVAKLHRKDEIGTLSAAFHAMTRQLSRRIDQEQLISDISRQFLHLSAAKKIDRAFLQALKKIGEYTGADRSYVGEFSLEERLVGQTHEWCRQGIAPQTDNIFGLSLDNLSWFVTQLEEKGHILAPAIEALPQDAAYEKELWKARGLQSVIRVPMTYGGQLRGFVGIDAGQKRPWSQEEVALLQRVAELFYNTLERQWYQDRLAAEKEHLSVTLQSIGDGVITTDVDGRVLLINPVGEMLTGWQEDYATGHPIEEVFTILDENSRRRLSNPISGIIQTKRITAVPGQSILISRDGSERLIASSVAPILDRDDKAIGVVLVFRDITEKRRMQEEMLRVEKLESIGVLAGGIAHDFNNILTAVIGNIALTKRYAEQNRKVLDKLTEMEKAAFRARDLTQQLLTFSKGGEPVKKTVRLDQLLYDSAMFSLGGSNVGLEFCPTEDIWTVDADEGQFGQVINNLVLNAVQAMPDGGVLRAGIENVELPGESALPLQDGCYVKIELQDFGVGIPRTILGRIFDPFFTTKKNGSGLGLATCYSIVEKHGGHITVDSHPGRGTVFTLYFPASEKEIFTTPTLRPEMPAGSGNILLMDDEPMIREVVRDLLTIAGYKITSAKDGQEMLDLYTASKQNGNAFDVVIMDLTVPGGMGGKEAIGKLLAVDPQARAIVSSGYSTDPVMADFSRFGFAAAVSKPFRIEELCKTISNILSDQRPSQ
ncbi:MAG: ATP-binding protein [Desulfobacteraceae bacterium]